jgi:hypothetical protein
MEILLTLAFVGAIYVLVMVLRRRAMSRSEGTK